MTTQQQTSKQYFNSLTTIYLGLLSGQFALAVLSIYLNLGSVPEPDSPSGSIFIILAAILVLNGILLGQLVYKHRLKKIKNYDKLSNKMGAYRRAQIMRLAMLEGPSLLAIIFYFLTADWIFVGMAGLLMVYFLFLKPGIENASRDLELSSTDRLKLENPDEVIGEF